jgi:hypothetical protein
MPGRPTSSAGAWAGISPPPPPTPHEICKNGAKNWRFLILIDLKIAKTWFSTQKKLDKITSKMFFEVYMNLNFFVT